MDIKEFINKAYFYEKEIFMQKLCGVLENYVSCTNCPLVEQCRSKENEGLSCENVLEKYLTTD